MTLALPPMKRTALIVADLARSVDFYTDVFQLETWTDGVLEDPAGLQLLGLKKGRIRYHILKSKGIAFGMVGLFEVTDPAPETVSRSANAGVRIGEAVLVWETQQLDPVIDRLKARGAEWVCEPVPLFVPFFNATQREMTFRDPDGFAINLIEKTDGPEFPPEPLATA